MMNLDYDNMSLEEIDTLRKELNEQYEKRYNTEKEKIWNEVIHALRQYEQIFDEIEIFVSSTDFLLNIDYSANNPGKLIAIS